MLLGNPNAGKTTLFNKLTNSCELVGNYAGITVDGKLGKYKDKYIVDLPGIYSLIPYTNEEKVTIDYLNNNKIDLIINVIDINNLNRSLYLTSRLMDLNIPIVIYLSKLNKNINVNIKLLKNILGIEIITDTNIDNLKYTCSKKVFSTDYDIYKDIYNRYKVIDDICEKVIIKNKVSNIYIDNLLHNKILSVSSSIILFIAIYYISIKIIGNTCILFIINILNTFINYIIRLMNSLDMNDIFKDLIVNGIFKGISNIISFMPVMIILTFIISLLEDSGYITRMSLIFDKVLRLIKLDGKSFQPLLAGCTCSVLGIMATRTIKDNNNRLKTIFIIPLIPCSAKITVMIYITTLFFNNSFTIFLSFYIICLIVILISSLIIKGNNSHYLIDMPNMKIPSIGNALKNTYEKTKSYLFRLTTLIMFISIINWFLISFDINFNYGVSYNDSLMYLLGSKLSLIFRLFGKKENIAIITGIIAKEQVISTMSVFGNNLNKISAYVFCVFNIITIPCINTIEAIKKECGYKKMILYTSLYLLISYIVCLFIFVLV